MNTLECIKTRHSTRKFKPEPVAQELLDTVIDAGRRAPTGGNLQPTHFMVITNPDVLKELVTLGTWVEHFKVLTGDLEGLINSFFNRYGRHYHGKFCETISLVKLEGCAKVDVSFTRSRFHFDCEVA